ncbi:MAG TPA: hypothetical protein VGC36_14035 [Rhizomicrobium sp.]
MAFAATVGMLAGFSGADSAAPSAHANRCLRALAPLAQGGVPRAAGFAPAACPDEHVAAAFRRDAVRAFTVAARPIALGEIVPAYPDFGADMVVPGQRLHLVVRAGAVRIERQVEALQPARRGQRLFVRCSDGEILSVRYGGGAP